jgi:hypothetical protein
LLPKQLLSLADLVFNSDDAEVPLAKTATIIRSNRARKGSFTNIKLEFVED